MSLGLLQGRFVNRPCIYLFEKERVGFKVFLFGGTTPPLHPGRHRGRPLRPGKPCPAFFSLKHNGGRPYLPNRSGGRPCPPGVGWGATAQEPGAKLFHQASWKNLLIRYYVPSAGKGGHPPTHPALALRSFCGEEGRPPTPTRWLYVPSAGKSPLSL